MSQLCGDAHLSNFGGFASPERVLLFDLNDFDETLPGPFEYDVKRMAASFTIAARNNGFTDAEARAASLASATAYREAMLRFAEMGTMEIWYCEGLRSGHARCRQRRGPLAEGRGQEAGQGGPQDRDEAADKARTRDSTQALSKLAELVDGRYRIVSQPPVIVPVAGHAGELRLLGAGARAHGPRAVPRVPGHPARRSTSPAGTLRSDRHGPQGGRRRQRRHAGLHRVAAGP